MAGDNQSNVIINLGVLGDLMRNKIPELEKDDAADTDTAGN